MSGTEVCNYANNAFPAICNHRGLSGRDVSYVHHIDEKPRVLTDEPSIGKAIHDWFCVAMYQFPFSSLQIRFLGSDFTWTDELEKRLDSNWSASNSTEFELANLKKTTWTETVAPVTRCPLNTSTTLPTSLIFTSISSWAATILTTPTITPSKKNGQSKLYFSFTMFIIVSLSSFVL